MKLVREGVEHGEVKDGEELPTRELSPPQQRPRQQVSQYRVLEDMGQTAEVEDQRLTEELGPPQPVVQAVGDVAVRIRVAGGEEDESRPEEHGQPAGEEGMYCFGISRVVVHNCGTFPILSPQRFQNFKRPARKPQP